MPENLYSEMERLKQITAFLERRGPIGKLDEAMNALNNILAKKSEIESYQHDRRYFANEMHRFPEYPNMINDLALLCNTAEKIETPKAMVLETLKESLKNLIVAFNKAGQIPEQDEGYRSLDAQVKNLEQSL